MKIHIIPKISVALLLTALPVIAQTTNFFTDTFSNGSTLTNATPAPPTANSAGYQLISTKGWTPAPSLTPNDLRFGIASTSGGTIEAETTFAANPVALVQPGDFIQIVITFTNTSGLLTASGQLDIGLYNSGGVNAVPSGLNGQANSSNPAVTGGAVGWQGYAANIYFSGSNNRILTRAAQTSTAANSQDVLTSGSGTESYANPAGGVIGTALASTVSLTVGAVYTEVLNITLNGTSSEAITNSLYTGGNTNGTLIVQYGAIATNSTFLTGGFDSFGIGWLAKAATTGGTFIDISSVQISGQSSVITGPPTINTQPVSAVAATNGYASFSVVATGFDVTYQWFRNGAALANGGDISGVNASTLVISPAQAGDIFSGANGYYVVVSGASGFSTNSVTNSLSLIQSTNLIWTGNAGVTWDVRNTVNFKDTNGNAAVFTGGDPVTFNDTAASSVVSQTGNLGPSAVTVQTANAYTFQGNGSIVGPASVLLSGLGATSGQGEIILNAANTYSGGTTIASNLFISLGNYNGLGTGPVNLNDENGTLETTTLGSATTGINGTVNINSDYTFQIDGVGTFATVLLGDLDGVSGKTLTFMPETAGTTNRFRIYGTNTVCNAKLVLNGNATSQAQYFGTVLAPYGPSGVQMYNGVISGPGGFIQRGSGTTILTGANTYAGGTTPSTGAIGFGADSAVGLSSSPIGTGALLLAPEVPNTTGSGTVFAFGAPHTIGNPIVYPSATNNQFLVIAGTNKLTLSGTVGLNGLDGQGSPTNRTFSVTNNAIGALTGVISDGGLGYGVTKTGGGTLILNNTETYTGTTLANGGNLLVDGHLASASAVTVATNGTLGGTGTIPGTVTVQSGGNLAAGDLGIGTLTINNTLTFQAGSTNSVEVSHTGGTHDLVTVASVVYAGTLYATNLAGTSTLSDTYTIFNAASHTGNFTAIAGTPGPGLAWAFNPATGVLSVINGVSLTPTPITFSVTGGTTLNLSWPADHTGWHLQVQTNILSKGLGTNWVEVSGSTSVDATNFMVNATNGGAVFYRLVSP